MMNPEMMRIAQEQFSRMTPEQRNRLQQQVASMDPSVLQQAQQMMGSMTPEQMRQAQDQMKQMDPSTLEEQMGYAQGEVKTLANQQVGQATLLKNEGNRMHKAGDFEGALDKYREARDMIKKLTMRDAKDLAQACQLNSASCLLKLERYDEVVHECTDVLSRQADNVKALYRRGQAYAEQKKMAEAISDLRRAKAGSPDDANISDKLAEYEGTLEESTGGLSEAEIKKAAEETKLREYEAKKEAEQEAVKERATMAGVPQGMGAADVSPEKIEQVSKMMQQNPGMMEEMTKKIGEMNPEELERVTQAAAASGALPPGMNVSPEMLKQSVEMMKGMSPDDLKRMQEMAANMRSSRGATAGAGVPSTAAAGAGDSPSSSSSSPPPLSGSPGLPPGMPMDPANMSPEEQARMQKEMMNNPEMMKMASEMMKNMSPEQFASMSKAAGMDMSEEQAKKVSEMMSNMSPETMQRMMKVAGSVKGAADSCGRVMKWVRSREGLLVIAVLILIVALLQAHGFFG